jgi:UDP-N-acetylglucosamine 2-epimerase (non-hydrolysing)
MGNAIAHVVGARPNFMKAAPVIDAVDKIGLEQHLIHTGQHYDEAMSDVFFADLAMRRPDRNLGIGSGSHAAQTAAIMVALEGVLVDLEPRLVVVYGDVNSTLAAAVVASKLGTPVAHVEAGLRSFDRSMPEEINRRVTDALSDLLFVTAPEGVDNLAREGAPTAAVRFVGNPMIDTLLKHRHRFDPLVMRQRFGLDGPYAAATIHRPSNVDEAGAAQRIVTMLRDVARRLTVVLPLHPRGRDALNAAGLAEVERLVVVEPLGYLEFMSLVVGAEVVITDSGGIQEETTGLGIPCLTVRPNTERPVTVTHGTNRLVMPDAVAAAVDAIRADGAVRDSGEGPPLWDGHAGERIAQHIGDWLAAREGQGA